MKLPSVNLKEIGSIVTRMIGKGKLWTRMHEPELWIGAGLVVGVGAVVAAGMQGTKCHDILEAHKDHMEEIEKAVEYAEMDGQEYTEKEQRRDRWAYHAEAAVEVGKKFLVPAAMAAAAGAMIIEGMLKEKARTRAAVAWGQGILCAFGAYRANVIKDQGVEKDKYYMTGLRNKTVEETKFDENGKAYIEEKTVEDGKIDGEVLNKYFTFIFGPDTSSEACYDGQKNLHTLMQVENAAHINMITNWFTDYNWIKKDAGLDPKYYPPTGYGQMFGAKAERTENGWKRKIHLDAHIIPGRDDGACLVTVYGMDPLVDMDDVTKVLGEETIGVAYLEDFKDDINFHGSEFLWTMSERAREEAEENRRRFLEEVNAKEV